jgi:hypothetical protein
MTDLHPELVPRSRPLGGPGSERGLPSIPIDHDIAGSLQVPTVDHDVAGQEQPGSAIRLASVQSRQTLRGPVVWVS